MGEEHQQSTDILSVWEGDSITITCSMKASDSEVTTLLTTGIQSVIVCTYKQSNSSVLPALADRAECSKEGRDLRITLHNAQESDSNIYQCIKFIKIRGRHKKLNGKTTIVVVKGYTSGVVEQSPLYANPQQGKSISITCALNNFHEEKGMYLLKTHTQRERVLYVSSQNASSTVFPPFANRLEYSKEEQKIVITLHNLQENDSDIYVCAGVLNGSSFLSVNRRGTMVLIKG
ncbi:uncharacterized protein LOC115599334 [Calypte anna]|uniref:uncharacterized protein LOC115599334 n=1 Tax=Calypte anna TaxID=9244 RepID=UPI0011C386F1|nr:uncharacterized protein LOC115599334 [Calypte anna]